MKGIIESINISDRKGVCKKPVSVVKVIENYGIENDAHSSYDTIKQISLLAAESIYKMKRKGIDVDFGSFAENISVGAMNLSVIKIGDRLKLGSDVIIEITQIGKKCHSRCSIFYKAGYCIMPQEGIFAKVIKGGIIRKGDVIEKL